MVPLCAPARSSIPSISRNFAFDAEFDTWNTNPSGKVTYQLNQNHKLIGYYQWNMKTQPTRLAGCCNTSYTYNSIEPTVRQASPSWVWKGEWNGTLSDRIYLEARYGDFGYYDPRIANSDEDYFFRDSTLLTVTGAHARSQTDRDRKQATGALTYFLDTKRGSHTFKIGGEIYLETQWGGREERRRQHRAHLRQRQPEPGDLRHSDGASRRQPARQRQRQSPGREQARSAGPLRQRHVGDGPRHVEPGRSMGSLSRLDAGATPTGVCDWSGERGRTNFEERSFYTWNSIGPRAGVTYDVAGDGKTVVKASYGLFWHNPGPATTANANPNATNKSVTYKWNDANRDKRFQLGEQIGAPTSSTLAGNIQFDSNTKQPYSHDVAVYLERQIGGHTGNAGRICLQNRGRSDRHSYNPFRPISAYTVPFAFVDVGPDGRPAAPTTKPRSRCTECRRPTRTRCFRPRTWS